MLSSRVVAHGFESWSFQSKDDKIGSCGFSAKHAALISKNIDRFVSDCCLTPNKQLLQHLSWREEVTFIGMIIISARPTSRVGYI